MPAAVLTGWIYDQTQSYTSALIGFIKDDAEFIAEKIAEYQRSKRPAQAGTPVEAGATSEARSSERS